MKILIKYWQYVVTCNLVAYNLFDEIAYVKIMIYSKSKCFQPTSYHTFQTFIHAVYNDQYSCIALVRLSIYFTYFRRDTDISVRKWLYKIGSLIVSETTVYRVLKLRTYNPLGGQILSESTYYSMVLSDLFIHVPELPYQILTWGTFELMAPTLTWKKLNNQKLIHFNHQYMYM